MKNILADALTGNLCKPDLGHRENSDFRAIPAKFFPKFIIHLLLVPFILEIDKIDDDDSTEIPEPHLAADLSSGLKICPERVQLLLTFRGITSAVHVNDNHCLGLVDNDITPAFQP